MYPYANRYYCCSHPDGADGHDAGDGSMPRRYCSGCGARILTERGLWGVFKPAADGNPDGPPLTTRKTRRAAAKHAASESTRQDTQLTTGWIPEEKVQA
jgi:hypothetical protein